MTPNNLVIRAGTEYRPCWVDGRRAMFHRWTDSARPVAPRGVEEENTTRRYQLHNVHGIVEYEDGTIGRVWPSAIQFADTVCVFEEWDWEAMEHHRDEQAAMIKEANMDDDQEQPAAEVNMDDDQEQPAAEVNKECETCVHVTENVEFCRASDNHCNKCTVRGCVCKRCENYDMWEAKHGEE